MSFNPAAWTVVAVAGLALFAVLVFAAGMYFHTREPRTGPRMTVREFIRGIKF
jgi:hypothetical protein